MALRILLAALAVVAWSALPALALSPSEAGKVVALVEKLGPERGEIAYDESEADSWFEDDEAYQGLIAKAGFTQESWKEGFDAVLKGYFASLPQAEIDATLNSARIKLSQSNTLTTEQKAEIAASLDEHVALIRAYRDEGRAYIDVVRPLLPRLKPFISSGGN